MSGLPPIFYGDRWQGLLNSRNPFGDFSKDKFLEALLELPVPEPAKTFSFKENYSNIGAALLGMTLSNIDEDSYEGTILLLDFTKFEPPDFTKTEPPYFTGLSQVISGV